MEDSKRFEDVVVLGKRLVSELGPEQSTSTLGNWIAHHIAELIVEAEQADEEAKTALEDRCRSAILALWKHIEVFPRGTRPLEDLEALLETIRALDPNNGAFFYQKQAQEAADKSNLSEESKEWLALSRGLDYSARVLIEMCLKNAANCVPSEIQEWYELSETVSDIEPLTIRVVRSITNREDINTEKEDEAKKALIESLQDRKERLQGMIQMAELLASSIEQEVKELAS